MNVFAQLLEAIAAEGAGALVSLTQTDGSVPREAGTTMVVRPSGAFQGTIGGGALEWEALAEARAALAAGRGPALTRMQHLGPDLGQCCGGRVQLRIETFDARDRMAIAELAEAVERGFGIFATHIAADGRVDRRPLSGDLEGHPPALGFQVEKLGPDLTQLYLFGAGHVGRALVLALAPLPFRIRWIDERQDAFPTVMPPGVEPIRAQDHAAEIAAAPAGTFMLVMTHSHALDFDIVAAALSDGRFPYVGLIGSATKRARFERRLQGLGVEPARIASLVCPIGIAGIDGKEPAVIAASTAAQLLLRRDQVNIEIDV